MFYSDLKPNLCHKIILTTGPRSLIIDLSDDVFFSHFLSTFFIVNKNIRN